MFMFMLCYVCVVVVVVVVVVGGGGGGVKFIIIMIVSIVSIRLCNDNNDINWIGLTYASYMHRSLLNIHIYIYIYSPCVGMQIE